MRPRLRDWMMIVLLIVSVEGAADLTIGAHPAPILDSSSQCILTATNIVPSIDDHCEHCCHGHIAGVDLDSVNLAPISGQMRYFVFIAALDTLDQSPPLPPPL